MKENAKSWFKYVSWGTSIAGSLAGLVGGGFLLGQYLDRRWGLYPLLELTLMLTGLVLGAAYLVVTLKALGNGENEKP